MTLWYDSVECHETSPFYSYHYLIHNSAFILSYALFKSIVSYSIYNYFLFIWEKSGIQWYWLWWSIWLDLEQSKRHTFGHISEGVSRNNSLIEEVLSSTWMAPCRGWLWHEEVPNKTSVPDLLLLLCDEVCLSLLWLSSADIRLQLLCLSNVDWITEYHRLFRKSPDFPLWIGTSKKPSLWAPTKSLPLWCAYDNI